MKETYPAYGHKYGCYSFSTCILKPLSLKRKIGIGMDLFWEFSNIKILKDQDIEVKHDYEVIRLGINIGHQFDFSHLAFVNQIGVYLYAKDKSDGPIY